MSENIHPDFDRERRIGFSEVVYGASKSRTELEKIVRITLQNQPALLITKLQPEKGDYLIQRYPDAFWDPVSGIFIAGEYSEPEQEGTVAILSGGTSDTYLVNEIYYTLSFFGLKAQRYQDIGVAGLHRLTDKIEELKNFRILIVVAGFEGALPTVVGGLLPQPVIAVPAAVGYGVSAGGRAALDAMLSSCANGITVVNIDNGYGAAMAALRILRTFELNKL